MTIGYQLNLWNMYAIGDMLKLHIDGGSDLGGRGSPEGWGYPKLWGRFKAGGGRRSLYTMVPTVFREIGMCTLTF